MIKVFGDSINQSINQFIYPTVPCKTFTSVCRHVCQPVADISNKKM